MSLESSATSDVVNPSLVSVDDAGGLAADAPSSSTGASPDVHPAFEPVPAVLRPALAARGFSELTAVQRAVLGAEVEGRDLQISSQTGSGKTVALGFVLTPSLCEARGGHGPDALIIVPTRELANQVCEELGWLFAELGDVEVGSVTGGTPLFRDRTLLAKKPRVLVGTPGRLLDHVTSGKLDLAHVRELVLDEADQMLDMGFREELEGILDATPTTRRTHLVSATFPAGIERLAARYQTEAAKIEGTRLGDANRDIQHEGYLVRERDRYAVLVNLLLAANDARTLVFVERRSEALELAEKLEQDGFAAAPLSGELVQSQRERTLAAFRSGRTTVLVATDVAARGLDVPDVATVIHTAPCIDSQVYTHRSGRTGRAGQKGRSVLIASPNKKRRVARLLAEAGVELQWRRIPDPDDVREQVAARERAALETALDASLAEGASPEHLAHAESLLTERDGVRLVAALLARLEPERRIEVRDLAPADAHEDHRGAPNERIRPFQKKKHHAHAQPGRFHHGARQDRHDRRDDAGGRFDRREAKGGRRHGRGPGSFDSVRFFMNWGMNQGATPGRLLASVCRRGEVSGDHIGSIAIHPNASTFDVSAEVAERFERLAGRRDPRDPKTMIRRDRGPQSGSGAGPRRGSSFHGKPGSKPGSKYASKPGPYSGSHSGSHSGPRRRNDTFSGPRKRKPS